VERFQPPPNGEKENHMSASPKYLPHYTYADYASWQGDWELWHGVPVAMTPSPFGRHQWIAGEISYQFQNSLRRECQDCFVLMETDWIVADDTVVRPDVVIVCGEFPERHIMVPPRLIVEILSPSTEEKDRTAKRDLYASQAVEYYLIVDPTAKRIEAFQRDAVTGLFDVLRTVTPDGPMEFPLSEKCVATLDAASLFRV
jgi:Uma2 family endonuclease